MSKQVNFSNSGEIDPTKVKEAVFSQVDFPLDVAVLIISKQLLDMFGMWSLVSGGSFMKMM